MKPFKINDTSEFILCVGCFCFGCGIIISLVVFIIKCIKFSKDNTVSKSMISFAVLASLCYTVSTLFLGFYWLCVIGVFNGELFENFCDLFQIFFWHLGQVMVYCYLLTRLFNGFKGTIHSIEICTSIILCSLLSFYLIGCFIILGITIWYIVWFTESETHTIDNLPYITQFEYAYKSITLIVDVILSSMLLGIFVFKLYKISESLKTMMDDEYDLISNNPSNNDTLLVQDRNALQLQHENIYNVMSKVLILGIIMIAASQIVLILSLVNWAIHQSSNFLLSIIYGWFKGLHTFITSLSVFLGFEFTHNWYIYCCYRCHNKISNAIIMVQ